MGGEGKIINNFKGPVGAVVQDGVAIVLGQPSSSTPVGGQPDSEISQLLDDLTRILAANPATWRVSPQSQARLNDPTARLKRLARAAIASDAPLPRDLVSRLRDASSVLGIPDAWLLNR